MSYLRDLLEQFGIDNVLGIIPNALNLQMINIDDLIKYKQIRKQEEMLNGKS